MNALLHWLKIWLNVLITSSKSGVGPILGKVKKNQVVCENINYLGYYIKNQFTNDTVKFDMLSS